MPYYSHVSLMPDFKSRRRLFCPYLLSNDRVLDFGKDLNSHLRPPSLSIIGVITHSYLPTGVQFMPDVQM